LKNCKVNPADRYAPADSYVEPVKKVGKQHLADDA